VDLLPLSQTGAELLFEVFSQLAHDTFAAGSSGLERWAARARRSLKFCEMRFACSGFPASCGAIAVCGDYRSSRIRSLIRDRYLKVTDRRALTERWLRRA
jgi:hypothetical protein